MEVGRKVFSVNLRDSDLSNLDVIIKYFLNKKGFECTKGAVIKKLISDKYADIVAEADSLGKSLEDYLENR